MQKFTVESHYTDGSVKYDWFVSGAATATMLRNHHRAHGATRVNILPLLVSRG